MKNHLYILLLWIAFACPASAQNLANQLVTVNETVFVQSNASTFVTGETMLFSLYALQIDDQKPSTVSQIAYLQLIDSDRKVVFSQKVLLKNASGWADFFIPTSLKTGRYKLIAFTKWMLTASRNHFFETDVAIINPFAVSASSISQVTPKSKATETVNNDQAIGLAQKTFGKREKVALQLELPQHGRYTVSIRKKDSLALCVTTENNVMRFAGANAKNKISFLQGNKIAYLPELRGELVSGRISASGKSVKDKTVALSAAGKSFILKLTNTAADGKFLFLLDKIPAQKQLTVQVLGEDRNDYTVELDAEIQPDLSGLVFDPTPFLHPSYKKAIETRAVASQIESAYYDLKKDSITSVASIPPFYNGLQKDYVLDDFTRFPSLRETIIEVLTEVSFRKRSGKYSIGLKNYGNDLAVFGPPLVMVDGLPIQDVNPLFDWAMERVQKVSIINEPYIYGPKMFGGIINFITKSQDFGPLPESTFFKKIEWPQFAASKTRFTPNYAAAQRNRVPDYRQQLFWLGLQAPSKEPVIFYTADLSGVFEVDVQGFTVEGQPFWAKSQFEVR